MKKQAGVRFNENLHIEFIYDPESDSVLVYRNGELISDSYITPEELATILEDYVTKNDIATTSSDGLMTSSDKTKLNGIASGAEVNVQSDWSESDSSSDAFIKHKPTIPTRVSQLTNDSNYINKVGTALNLYNIEFECQNDFALLKIKNGSDYFSLVFFNTGKVDIQRFADGSWKPTVTLRSADS